MSTAQMRADSADRIGAYLSVPRVTSRITTATPRSVPNRIDGPNEGLRPVHSLQLMRTAAEQAPIA